MSRGQAVALGLLTGAALAVAILLIAASLRGEPGEATAAEQPVHLREGAEPPSGSPVVRSMPVTIYQRAETLELRLVPLSREIVWFPAPVDRARQIVRLVLEGGGEEGALAPTSVPLRYREVFIDAAGIAWVDLESAGVASLRGSDEEQALVACLARSLVEGVDEVRAIGLLVGGEDRRTLAGHVDLGRTYRGDEWPLVGEENGSVDGGDESVADGALI